MMLSVIVVTLNRSEMLRRCLQCLAAQTRLPDQIIVVDGSKDDLSRQIVATHERVLYLRNERGYGNMAGSRNIGLQSATGDIIAFIDDDALAHPTWAFHLLETYSDSKVGAVGGRAINAHTPEEVGIEEIGRLKPTGSLAGNFDNDPGRVLEVDHIIGCNMSFRREVLAKLGGWRDFFTGTEVAEETDVCLRTKRSGYKILFNPAAVVDHIGSPQAKGKRFDGRYRFYHRRNNYVLLLSNFGFGSIVTRYIGLTAKNTSVDVVRKIGGAFYQMLAETSGTLIGLWRGMSLRFRYKDDVFNHSAQGKSVRAKLQKKAVGAPENAEKTDS